MRKLMFVAAVMTAGISLADVQSANIVGYSHTLVPSYYSFFTPQFKGIAKKISIDDLTPMLTNGVALSKNSTVSIQVFSDSENGYYTQSYGWFPNLEGGCWSLNGTEKHTDKVEFSAGEGFVVYNKVRVNAAETAEASSGSRYRPIHFLHSGEVVLEQPTVVPSYYSFAGNNGFETINLDQLVPMLTNGVALTKNSTVSIQIFSDSEKGYYTQSYGWFPNLEGGCWSLNGTEKHTDVVEFAPGQGYVIYNKVRVNAAETAEASSGSRYRPILMTVKPKDK